MFMISQAVPQSYVTLITDFYYFVNNFINKITNNSNDICSLFLIADAKMRLEEDLVIRRSRPTMISAKYRAREERRRLLKISAGKLRKIEDPETSLCRSVLINNAVRRLQRENRDERARNYNALPVVAAYMDDTEDTSSRKRCAKYFRALKLLIKDEKTCLSCFILISLLYSCKKCFDLRLLLEFTIRNAVSDIQMEAISSLLRKFKLDRFFCRYI